LSVAPPPLTPLPRHRGSPPPERALPRLRPPPRPPPPLVACPPRTGPPLPAPFPTRHATPTTARERAPPPPHHRACPATRPGQQLDHYLAITSPIRVDRQP